LRDPVAGPEGPHLIDRVNKRRIGLGVAVRRNSAGTRRQAIDKTRELRIVSKNDYKLTIRTVQYLKAGSAELVCCNDGAQLDNHYELRIDAKNL